MPTFIESCHCRGARPKGIVGRDHVPRPEIIARLLKDRHAPRFLIAPGGFGKSTIAYEYAHLVFGFKHVFWIRGDSPCFLRDLDATTILDEVYGVDGAVGLVVIDDVPQLDTERSAKLDALIGALVERDCEVLVLTTPSCDTFSALPLDAMVMHSHELLLTEGELMALGIPLDAPEGEAVIGPARRVACVCWGAQGTLPLAKGLKNEVLPLEIRALILALLLVGRGNLRPLAAHFPESRRSEVLTMLERDYCFLGVDQGSGLFDAVPMAVDEIAKHVAEAADRLARTYPGHDLDAFSFLIADELLAHDEGRRACTVVRRFASPEGCARWAVLHGRDLVRSGVISDLIRFCLHARKRGKERRGELDVILLACFALVGSPGDAHVAAQRAAASDGSERDVRLVRDTALHLFAPELRIGLHDLAEQAGEARDRGLDLAGIGPAPYDGSILLEAIEAAQQVAESGGGIAEAKAAAEDPALRLTGSRSEVLLIAALLLWQSMVRPSSIGIQPSSGEEGMPAADENDRITRTRTFAREALRLSWTLNPADDLAILRFMLLERLTQGVPMDPLGHETELPEGLVAEFLATQLMVRSEAEAYQRHASAQKAKALEYRLSHPDPYRKDEPTIDQILHARTTTPLLDIRLFGGLNVSIGDEAVDPRALGSRKVRAVLAILAANLGKEVSREKMADLLWPEDGMLKFRRNFYNIWSKLKRALAIGGTCPYLIRTQSGCRFDERYVTCDISDFDEVCRSMLFGFEDLDNWERVYSKVVGTYAEDVLPGDFDCEFVNALRDRCRAQIVDAMICASRKLLGQGIADGALWFAREAMRRDDKREDCYIALMEAQIASDQRGYAIQTYFDCRRFLSEELGIDPSMKVVELYRSIIETESELI